MLLAAGNGLHIPTTEELFAWPDLGFGLNKVGLLYILAAVLSAIIWIVASRKQQLVPKGIQNLMEPLYTFIREQVVIEVMGNRPDALRYVPFLGTLFTFILFCNIFEVIPGINFPPTARMAGPAFLAIMVWFVFNVQGIISQGWATTSRASCSRRGCRGRSTSSSRRSNWSRCSSCGPSPSPSGSSPTSSPATRSSRCS